tara:strand:- start:106 stop:297 length:192 start_codon:yes stop_codon:yes gene_type:complete
MECAYPLNNQQVSYFAASGNGGGTDNDFSTHTEVQIRAGFYQKTQTWKMPLSVWWLTKLHESF